MPNLTRNGTFTPSALDRLRSGNSGPVVALPSQATLRPSLLETVFASRSERALLRERDTAAVTVESEQIAAAVEVAVARTHDTKEVALKSLQAETARQHTELEEQMQKDSHAATTAAGEMVTHMATELVVTEKRLLDGVKAQVDRGEIDPDRAQILADIVRSNTDRGLGEAIDLRDKICDGRTDRVNRALSRKR